jgi:hypothetical protein
MGHLSGVVGGGILHILLGYLLSKIAQLALSVRMVIKQLVVQFRNYGKNPLCTHSVYRNLDSFGRLDLLSQCHTLWLYYKAFYTVKTAKKEIPLF